MGLRYVKGLGERERTSLEASFQHRPYESLDDFVRRSGLREDQLTTLAEAGALESFGQDRRQALWKVRRLARASPILLTLHRTTPEPSPRLPPLDALTPIAWDYERSGHSARGHLLGPLRPWLLAQGLRASGDLNALPDGRRVRYAGLVICRQRPGTAKGVLFATLEDESGFVNLVVWESVYEQHRVLCRAAPFLGVTGKIQSQEGVTHLIADHLWLPDLPPLDQLSQASKPASRDFH